MTNPRRESGTISWKLIPAAAAAGILAALAIATFPVPWPSWLGGASGAAPASSTENEITSGPPQPITYSFSTTSTPARIVIPSINVNAVVEPVGIARSGLMAVTESYFTVGWYKHGTVPGDAGSAVMAGHLDQVNSPYAVFYDLDKLRPGDEVRVIDSQGRTIPFTVVESKVEPFNAPTENIFLGSANDPPGESRLNLVTCTGTWIQEQRQYDKRLVVFTKRSDVIR